MGPKGRRAYRSLAAIFSLGCFLCDLCAFAVRPTGPPPPPPSKSEARGGQAVLVEFACNPNEKTAGEGSPAVLEVFKLSRPSRTSNRS